MPANNKDFLSILRRTYPQGRYHIIFNVVLAGLTSLLFMMLQHDYGWNPKFIPVFSLIAFALIAISSRWLLPFPVAHLTGSDVWVMKSLWLLTLVLVACLVAVTVWVDPLTIKLIAQLSMASLWPACLATLRYEIKPDN
jgi:phosphatidylserine synthase